MCTIITLQVPDMRAWEPYSSFSVTMIKYPDLSIEGVKQFLLTYSSREGIAQHNWEGSLVAGAQG